MESHELGGEQMLPCGAAASSPALARKPMEGHENVSNELKRRMAS